MALHAPTLLLLAPLLQGASPPDGEPPLVALLDVFGAADPAALTVDHDRGWILSAEGAQVQILDARRPVSDPEAELGVIPVDAATITMEVDGDRLWVAGGSQGLLCVSELEGARRVATVADRGDHVCTDVEVTADGVLALFAARDDSSIVLFARDGGEPLAETSFARGTAWALDARGADAFVALGPGGIARVRFERGALRVEPGPGAVDADPSTLVPPSGVRHLTVAGDRLWGASDDGLLEVDLDAPWSRDTPIRTRPLARHGLPTYACRVDARGDLVAVATNLAPNAVLDGGPYSTSGAMSADGLIGNVPFDAFRRGRGEHLVLLRRDGERLRRVGEAELGGGWRGLTLTEDGVIEQHIGEGLIVRRRTASGLELASRRRPTGYPAGHGVFSVIAPDRLLLGVDSGGSRFGGYLSAAGGVLRTVAADAPVAAPLGVLTGQPWAGDEPGVEWLVDGDGFELRLHRLHHAEGLSVDTWPIAQALDADGRRGHTYFHGVPDGERVLVARCGTRDGLLVFTKAALIDAAREAAPGTTLDVAPLHAVATLDENGTGSARAMSLDVATLPDGRRLAALAAGWSAETGEGLVQLYELLPDDAPRRVGSLLAPGRVGNALSLEFARRGDRLLLAVADLGFGLRTYDVTDPTAPAAGPTWEVPPNDFDGAIDSAIDVTVRGRHAYVACGRLGLVCLDLGDWTSERAELAAIADTPGYAYGVVLGEIDGAPVLAVGDHQGGVRLYGPRED